MNLQLYEQYQTDEMETLDRWNGKARQWNEEARPKNSNRSKERENIWLGPTEIYVKQVKNTTLCEWKVLQSTFMQGENKHNKIYSMLEK